MPFPPLGLVPGPTPTAAVEASGSVFLVAGRRIGSFYLRPKGNSIPAGPPRDHLVAGTRVGWYFVRPHGDTVAEVPVESNPLPMIPMGGLRGH